MSPPDRTSSAATTGSGPGCARESSEARLGADGNSVLNPGPGSSAATASPAYVAWYGRGRKQNWTTPSAIFDPLHDEYDFTLDGASEPGNGLLPRASTVEAPLAWDGERVFCNPPWSNIKPFVELAASADLAVLLVPARTNARWFHRALELGAAVRYFLGRPSFESGPEGQKGHNSPVDCVLLVFDRWATTEAAA